MSNLKINVAKAVEAISDYLVELVKRDSSNGVILGLSGGLDSSVLAALAVRALGPKAVSVVYLCDRDSDAEIARNARLIADFLGLKLEVRDITGDMAKLRIYAPLFMKLLRLSPVVARISSATYEWVAGETPFMSTLRVGSGETLKPWYKRVMFNLTMRHVDSSFTHRHTFRRTILEGLAKQENLVLIGAANRSEFEVGWFVKDGIDDLPVQPMTGLFKTQVRQIAEALELPKPVRNQLPSPDMAKGVTDEFGIGHDYREVDIVIDGFDRGLSDQQLSELGIPRAEVEDIRELMRLSGWKRASPHERPPVSGKFGSDFRS